MWTPAILVVVIVIVRLVRRVHSRIVPISPGVDKLNGQKECYEEDQNLDSHCQIVCLELNKLGREMKSITRVSDVITNVPID